MKAGITIRYGPDAQSRNRRLFETALSSIDPAGPDLLWVVNTRHRQRQLAGQFLEKHAAAFDIPVVTLAEFYRRLSETLSGSRRLIPSEEKEAILHRILASSSLHAGSATSVHLRRHVSGYISFVKGLHIEEESLLRLRYARFRLQTNALDESMIRVFAEYQEFIEDRQLEDWEGMLNRVYTQLLTGALDVEVVFPALQALYLEAPRAETAVESGILRLVCGTIPSICISVNDHGNNPESVRAGLGFLAHDTQVEWVHHAGRDEPPQRVYCRPGTREDEIVLAARTIRALQSRNGRPPESRIAVVCSRPEAYSALVSEVFEEWGIRYLLLRGADSRESSFLAIVSKYLDLVYSGFDLEILFDLLERVGGSDGIPPRQRLCRLERLIRSRLPAAEAGAGLDQLTNLLEALRSGDLSVSDSKDLDQDVEDLIALVRLVYLDITPSRTWEGWCELLLERLSLLGPRPDSATVTRKENLFLLNFCRRLREEAVSWEGIQLGFPIFLSIIREHIGNIRASAEFECDAVVVGSPEDLEQSDFDYVFWVGLVDGEFPTASQQRLFFEDVHDRHWGLPTWKDRLARARELFRDITSSVGRAVFLTAPIRSGETLVLPSPLLLESGIGETAEPVMVHGGRLVGEGVVANILRGRKVLSLRERRPVSQFNGFLRTAGMRAEFRKVLFPGGIRLSPGSLEEYHRCGFRYFLTRILGVEAVDDSSDRVGLNFGNLIHSVLHRFAEEGIQPATDSREDWLAANRPRMKAILEEELRTLPGLPSPAADLFWRDRLNKLSSGLEGAPPSGMLNTFLEQTWDCLQTHRILACEATLGPVRIGGVRGGPRGKHRRVPVYLRGKVDRLDKGAGSLRVIDYKTGRSPRGRVLRGWGFQLPLYAALVEEEYSCEIVEAGFYLMRLPLEVGLQLLEVDTGEATRSLRPFITYFRRKALRAARSLYMGRFPFTLLTPGEAACNSCEFRQVCRYDPESAREIDLLELFPQSEQLVENGRWSAESGPFRDRSRGSSAP